MDEQKATKFWLRNIVEVKDARSYFNGTLGFIRGVDKNDDDTTIYQINTDKGERWFAEDQLELFADPRDSEIERLRSALKPFAQIYNSYRENGIPSEGYDTDFWNWVMDMAAAGHMRLLFERAYEALHPTHTSHQEG